MAAAVTWERALAMGEDGLLVLVVAAALVFDFTNGFHDSANAMATSIATRALAPRVAVGLSAVLNFAGAFISIAVATTIAKGIVDSTAVGLPVIFAALLGAITWNLVTWLLGLPSSSSHALIGGLVGAALAASGAGAVNGQGILSKVIIPALLAPVLAGVVALVATVIAYRLRELMRPEVAARGFRLGQIGTASLVSLAHGTNDAQKTMGVITLALIAHGSLDAQQLAIPLWVKLAAASSMALGTYAGGWRIIRTLGTRLTPLEPPQGFAAEASGASVILASSYHGFPLSTTQVVSGAVIGTGMGRRLAAVHWDVAGRMVTAWVLTVPAAAAIGWAAYELSSALGSGNAGPAVLTLLAACGFAGLFALSRRHPVTPADV
jgi:PiT family inorganic phosphate transporter